jgi:Lamin Tail Domain
MTLKITRPMTKTILALLCCCALCVPAQSQVVITEIMYNPPEEGVDSLEFIEFHNPGTAPADIAGYAVGGLGISITYAFPAGTTIPANGYLVLAKSSRAMRSVLGATALQWTEGGTLSNTRTILSLRNTGGTLIDEVFYSDSLPWPRQPDGNGPSLVLCNPASDNSLAANWSAATTSTGRSINSRLIFANPGAPSQCNAVATYPQRTIAQVTTENADGRADSTGLKCELQGLVLNTNLRPAGIECTMVNDDGTAGIGLFRATGTFGYTPTPGDRVTVRGAVSQFNGLTQLTLDTLFRTAQGVALPQPSTVTALDESAESRLVLIRNVRVATPAQWTGMGTGFNVDVTNGTQTFVMRIDNDVDLYRLPAPTTAFDLVGIGGQFDNSSPFTAGYQIVPRSAADLRAVSSIQVVDFSASVRLWPNPVQDMLLIETAMPFDRIQVIGMDGAVLYSVAEPAASLQVPSRDWPAGAYAVRFERGRQIWVTQAVKR